LCRRSAARLTADPAEVGLPQRHATGEASHEMEPAGMLQAVPVGKSNTNVVMMQAAEDGPRFDAPEGVNWSPRRRILVQGQVGSAPIVVARITAQQMEKVALSQDNHVVQTVPSDRTDRPLAISVLPG